LKKRLSLDTFVRRRYMLLTLTLTLVTVGTVLLFHLGAQIYLSSFLKEAALSQTSAILSHHSDYALQRQQEESAFLLSLLEKISDLRRKTSSDLPLDVLLSLGVVHISSVRWHPLLERDLHLYRISPEGVVTETTFFKDLGLDLSRYPRFWKKLLSLEAGESITAEPIPSSAEGILTRYVYIREEDGSFLQISLRTENFYLTEMLQILKNLPLVRGIALYHYPTLTPATEEMLPLTEEHRAFLEPLLAGKSSFLSVQSLMLPGELFFLWKKDDLPSPGDHHLQGMWLVHLQLYVGWFQKLSFLFLLSLLVALLGTGLLFSLRGKRLAQEIQRPVQELLRRMQDLSENTGDPDLQETFLEGRTSSPILEVEELSQGFEKMTLQVQDAFLEEKEALRREQEITERLDKVLETTLELTEAISSKSGTLFSTALKNAISLVPEAGYGAITEIEEGICHFRATWNSPQASSLQDILFPHSRNGGCGSNTIRERHYADTLPSSLNKDIRKKILQTIPPARETLVKPLFFGNHCAGELVVSILENSPHETFSQKSIRVVEAFGNVLAAFFGMDGFIKSQGLFQKELLMTITGILETHDAYTQGHSESVALLGGQIARALHLPEREVQQTYWAGLVHDIGKILIPKEILNKPSSLTPEEYALIQEHPALGYAMLSKAERLQEIAPFILHHHERWDGRGYPQGLSKEEIPQISRILAVADTWDAMTSNRSYRKALPEETARREILHGKGTQLDPHVVEAFFSVLGSPSENA